MKRQRSARQTANQLSQRSPTLGNAPLPPTEASAPLHNLLALQDTLGNQAVAHLIQAEEQGRHSDPAESTPIPPLVTEAVRSPGQPLDPATRAWLEPRLGQDFSQVRVHTDGRAAAAATAANASAYTVGRDVVFGAGRYAPHQPEGQHLLAHELAHIAQTRGRMPGQLTGLSQAQSAPERDANQAAAQVVAGGTARVAPTQAPLVWRQPIPAPAPRVAPPPLPMPADIKFMTLAGGKLTPALAREAMENYRKIGAVADRFKAFTSQHRSGNISRLLKALAPADAVAFRAEVQELLRWLQEAETRAASGMTDDKMAETQATFVQAEAEKQAKAELAAKAPKGKPPPAPTPVQVEAARKKKVEATSIAPSAPTGWNAMSKAQQDGWKKRGEAVIKAVVAHAKKVAPELGLTEHDFLADFPGVEGRGAGVLAYGQTGGPKGTLAVFGYEFVKSVEADPAYVMDIVVHEIFGHPEYGVYGSEYHLALYDKAMTKVPGYTQPVGPGRTTEVDAYAYQETEIYSLLRGFAYHKDVAAADKGKGLISVDAPAWVSGRVGNMKQQWEPGLAKAMVRGLYQRLRADPRITPAALDIFKNAVKANFDAKTATDLLK